MLLESETLRRLIQAYRASDAIMFRGEDHSAAQLMREAFAQALARFWDLRVQTWHGPQAFYVVDNNDPDSDERVLPYFEHQDVCILKMVASVINGDEGSNLYKKCEDIFDFSIRYYLEGHLVPPYRDLLRIRNCDIERFVKAVEESRPARGPDDLGPWHPSNLPLF